MNWLAHLSYFFGGIFAVNAVPHAVFGLTGRAFQSPFAKPPGQGLSSSTVNVLWAFLNATVAYVLVLHVGQFHAGTVSDVLAFGLGGLAIGLFSAHHFGQFHGGNRPSRS